MSDQPITVYGDSRSGNCYKIKLLCAEMVTGYDWREVDILKGDAFTIADIALLAYIGSLSGSRTWCSFGICDSRR
jgi:glutathione S-transferase